VIIPLLDIRGTRGEVKNSSDDWITKLLRIWNGQSSDECGDSTSEYTMVNYILKTIKKFSLYLGIILKKS